MEASTIIVIIIILIIFALFVWVYLHPTFPNYKENAYEFILEAARRPSEFKRYCKNIGREPAELIHEARETFDNMPIIIKINMWEKLREEDKEEIKNKMNDEEKLELQDHLRKIEELRQEQMLRDSINSAAILLNQQLHRPPPHHQIYHYERHPMSPPHHHF